MTAAELSGFRVEDSTGSGIAQKLNWLRAAVLGANDGIVSVAAVVVGVAAAGAPASTVLTAGSAALVGGAVSMALGEYVSVSSQRDAEHALIATQRVELVRRPAIELEKLTHLYEKKGLTRRTAERVALELSSRDALGAHLAVEYGIDQDDVVNPWHAAFASGAAFTIGALLPVAAALLPDTIRVPVTFLAVLVTLAITGYVAAWIGGSPRLPAILRLVVGGALALAATFAAGALLGFSGAV